VRAEAGAVRARTVRPVNLNFFCHAKPDPDSTVLEAWSDRLAAAYAELGVEPVPAGASAGRMAFDDPMCDVVEELRPSVVSFHFGLPPDRLVERVRATGATVMSSATSVAEARWLEDHGCCASRPEARPGRFRGVSPFARV
jgi:nitronate monooxygenase